MYTWKLPCDRLGILSISSILPQILPQTSSQTQGKQRVSRMEHQTPSVFPGNFRKRKVMGTLCFPFRSLFRYVFDVVEQRSTMALFTAPARTAVLRVQLRWTFVKHACGKLWTLVSTSETQTRINH